MASVAHGILYINCYPLDLNCYTTNYLGGVNSQGVKLKDVVTSIFSRKSDSHFSIDTAL